MNLLFWSGGKDAYLALHFFQRTHEKAEIKLLTTFDASKEFVPHQNIALTDIKAQARKLGLDLITVPLPESPSNEVYLNSIEETLSHLKDPIECLVFGDWHVDDIRQWREKVFKEMGYACVFPIWQKSIHDLLPALFLKPVTVKISAVNKKFRSLIQPGEVFDQKFVRQLKYLPEDIDLMGENGEFHTRIIFTDQYKNSE